MQSEMINIEKEKEISKYMQSEMINLFVYPSSLYDTWSNPYEVPHLTWSNFVTHIYFSVYFFHCHRDTLTRNPRLHDNVFIWSMDMKIWYRWFLFHDKYDTCEIPAPYSTNVFDDLSNFGTQNLVVTYEKLTDLG